MALHPGSEGLHVAFGVALHALGAGGRHHAPRHLHGDRHFAQGGAGGQRGGHGGGHGQGGGALPLDVAEGVEELGEGGVGEARQLGAQEGVRLDLGEGRWRERAGGGGKRDQRGSRSMGPYWGPLPTPNKL